MGLQVTGVREDDDKENQDRWQRWVIERPPPQTWKSVGVLMLLLLVGLVLGVLVTATFLLVAVAALFGLLRAGAAIVSGRIWGTAQPVERAMRRRFRWWTSSDD